MIRFTCPCGQVLAADDNNAGKMTACPKCGAHLPIPSASAIQPAQPAPRQPAPRREEDIASGLPPYRADRDEAKRRGEEAGTSGKAVTSMILGLLSFCLPLLLSIPAIILAILGLRDVKRGKKGTGLAVVGLITGILSLVLCLPVWILGIFGGIQGVREAAAQSQSSNNIKQMSLAFHSYQNVNRKLPGHAIYSEDGQPLLSWRVAILPYIEQDSLYKQFILDQPWDSPHNSKLLAQMPKIYAHPLDPEAAKNNLTHYQVFVGEPNEKPQPIFVKGRFNDIQLQAIPDGTSNTILIAEASTPVPWTKPDDLPYSSRQPLPRLGVAGRPPQVGLADSSARKLPLNITDMTLRAVITRDGGEVLGPDW